MYKVNYKYAYIHSWLLFDTTYLGWIDEIQSNEIKLNSVANDFFNQLLYYIEENNRSEGFGSIVGEFIWLVNNNQYRFLEMRWPMTENNT